MQERPTNGNVALLIDADNASAKHIDPVLAVLADLGTVNIRRMYGNWSKAALKPWIDKALRYALEPQQQFDLTPHKNAADMKMTIDAMDLLWGGRVAGFGIMSSDSDFTPLVTRIRQNGFPVYGFGASKTPDGFRHACNRFIDVETFERVTETSVPEVKANTPTRASVSEDVIRLLIDAYEASRQDAEGYASLSEIGARAGNRSSFDSRNYGFSRLVDLFAEVPGFEVDRRDGHPYVRHRG